MSPEPPPFISRGDLQDAPAVLPSLGALEILAASTDAFLFVGGDFRIRYLNPAAEVRLARPAATLYGQEAWSAWSGRLAARTEEALRRGKSVV